MLYSFLNPPLKSGLKSFYIAKRMILRLTLLGASYFTGEKRQKGQAETYQTKSFLARLLS